MVTIDAKPRLATDRLAVAGTSFLRSLRGAGPRIVQRLEEMVERARSRRALLQLSDDQLKDIGISRADAHGEAMRSFWD